ncbi:transporter substrate-binding domain-containing protein [Anaeromyxobacter oryzae]|uniref:histidine kinase n=1 Tax=Anaeromyxobacter oryzae TaxID=2918170 RepID=A0ABM7WPD2_9BACT|nr:transporter substrate-binding domain-containing protein [Anaeromyxobacter oryzae]BDG01325.1 histidine kinase [Anaeromyxobacter oryzae]
MPRPTCLLAVAALTAFGPALAADPAPTGSRTIVVGGDRDYPPYEFLDADGRPAGYDVDLTRAIAEVMGMRVEIRLGSWADMRAALRDGRIDALEGMSVSEEREAQFEFTPPHTIVHHAIFARKGTPPVASVDALRGHRVILHRGGIMDDVLTGAGMGDTLIRTATPADVLRLLASGEGEYAVVATLPGTYIARQLGLTNIEPVATGIAAHPYAYAVREGDAELRTRLAEGLAILKKTGRHQAIYDRWLGVLEPPAVTWATFAKYGAVVFVPLVLGLLGALAWTRSLHREVGQRTASLAREVAERQKAVEELRVNQQQLVQADKMAALGVLVSGVAHEINNPNGFILLNMPTLKGIYLDALEILDEHHGAHPDLTLGGIEYPAVRDEVPRMLDEMQGGARRIKRIVEDLKDFARREDAPAMAPLDLNAVVQAAVRLVEPSIRKATRRFDATYAAALPAVRGNTQRIEQVVVNLVLNACEALPAPERGVSVTTGADPARGVWVRVADEGVGIAPEHLPRLADPFFTTKRESGGTGLGLSVSAGIVKEHGGTLTFESRVGEGTAVTLTLPAAAGGGQA